MLDVDTPIIAVSSARGNSTHAIVRLTGEDIHDLLQQNSLVIETKRCVRNVVPLQEGGLPALLLGYAKNASFTGQETVECIVVNNSTLIQSLCELLIKTTAGRFAEPGEFTARAFFNGNVSLSEAEGVCATIRASNDHELAGANLLREGAFHKTVEPIAKEIQRILALVEAGIDFTEEEDVVAIEDSALIESSDTVIQKITNILDGTIPMASLAELPTVVLAGAINAGKSTLFNKLAGFERVVCSDVGGTTRDAIQTPVMFGNKEALLTDVAGFEESDNILNKSMQLHAKKQIDQADLILWCVPPGENEPEARDNMIVIKTKSDISEDSKGISVSSFTESGLSELDKIIENHIASTPTPSEGALALYPRHIQSLTFALHSLQQIEIHINDDELVASVLRDALNSLGSITGNITPDDLLGDIFSSFCIGK
tara:strand:+ start:355 stop:1641 length:1287 start_codon:yes stop_codon:yes gene_type:complete